MLAALEELERYKLLYDEEHQKCEEYRNSVEKLEKELRQKHDEKMRLQQVGLIYPLVIDFRF